MMPKFQLAFVSLCMLAHGPPVMTYGIHEAITANVIRKFLLTS